MTHDTDLIRRIDAMQATQVGPSDEWAKATKSGYNQAATDIAMNILKIPAAPVSGQVKPLVWSEIDQWRSVADIYTVDSTRNSEDGAILLLSPWPNPTRRFYSTEAAKAAAQADYAARIMAAIDVQPAPDVAQIRAEPTAFAMYYDGDLCGCAICADADATLWHKHEAICAHCYSRDLEDEIEKLRALIATPPPPDPMAERVAALVEAASTLLSELRANRYASDHMPESSRVALSAALAAMKGDAT